MSKVKWEAAPDVEARVRELVRQLKLEYVDCNHIKFMRSCGSKARALARIWELPRVWQLALGVKPHYIIEVIAERFDGLRPEEKTKTLIHELMHIPKSFSGAVVSHRRCTFDGMGGHRIERIDSKTVEKMFRQLNA